MALLYFFFGPMFVCVYTRAPNSVAGSCLASSSDVIDRWDPTTRSSQAWLYTCTVLRPRLRPRKAMSSEYCCDLTVCVCVCVCADDVLWELPYVGVPASEDISFPRTYLREHCQFQHYTYGLVSGSPWQSLGKVLWKHVFHAVRLFPR